MTLFSIFVKIHFFFTIDVFPRVISCSFKKKKPYTFLKPSQTDPYKICLFHHWFWTGENDTIGPARLGGELQVTAFLLIFPSQLHEPVGFVHNRGKIYIYIWTMLWRT